MALISRRAALAVGMAALSAGCGGRLRQVPIRDALPRGTGGFELVGGPRHRDASITVHYHWPQAAGPDAPILLVIPGAGRNGDDYRDAWIEHADAAGVFVAAPSYPEKLYDQAAYQMGGIIENLAVGRPLPGSSANVVYLRDEDIRFDVNPRRETWLFGDFERLFAVIRQRTGLRSRHYDMFGHSAGAQIVHRHALLWPETQARRLVAANAGFYTLPDGALPQPVVLAGLGVTEWQLQRAFARELVVLLGEDDNHAERGGSHLHTPLIDAQGDNRLARGRYFHEAAARRARGLGADFRWTLRTVPGVGHDFRGMSRAAARLLYG